MAWPLWSACVEQNARRCHAPRHHSFGKGRSVSPLESNKRESLDVQESNQKRSSYEEHFESCICQLQFCRAHTCIRAPDNIICILIHTTISRAISSNYNSIFSRLLVVKNVFPLRTTININIAVAGKTRFVQCYPCQHTRKMYCN